MVWGARVPLGCVLFAFAPLFDTAAGDDKGWAHLQQSYCLGVLRCCLGSACTLDSSRVYVCSLLRLFLWQLPPELLQQL